MHFFGFRDLRQCRAIDPSIRSSVFRYVRICESVFPFCQLPIFICPSRPFRRCRRSAHRVHRSIYQPLPVHPVSPNELHACMRACILIQSIRQSNSLVPASLLSCSLFLPPPLPSHSLLSIYLSSYPFAVVRLLPFRAPTWILHAASIYRTTYRAPVQLVLHSRESRESPGDSPRRDSLAWTSRGRAGNGIRKEVRARSRPTTRRR